MFKISAKKIKEAYAKKYLKKMVEDINTVSFCKDTLFDYLNKHFYSISVNLDLSIKQRYLHCFEFSPVLGGICLDMKYCELACDFIAIKLNESTIHRINKIIESTVTI